MKNKHHRVRCFINTTDISSSSFPIVNELVGSFTENEEFVKGLKSPDAYKWILNLILLNLYYLLIKILKKLELELDKALGKESDLFADVLTISRSVYGLLDPSIRKFLERRGIKIVQNIQSGIDTEYVQVDETKNKLLSVLLAQNTISYLSIPLTEDYYYSSVHTLTGKVYRTKKTSAYETEIIEVRGKEKEIEKPVFNYELLESSLGELIRLVRAEKHNDLDEVYNFMIEKLKEVSGLTYYEKDGTCVFRLPSTNTASFLKQVNKVC